MKHGTAYAKKLRKLYGRMKKVEPPAEYAEQADAVEQVVLAALSRDASWTQARRALEKLRAAMVDFNEIRVSPPRQLAELIGSHVPDGLGCATRLCASLNAVFNAFNALSMDALKTLGKREARQRLEKLDALGPYTVASVLLWSLGAHAIPVNARMLECLRQEGVVDPDASAAEVQSFLERHISPSEAKTFFLSLDHHAWSNSAARPRPGSVAASPGRARSSPPASGKVVPKR